MPVVVSASCRSLVQRSPTECGVCECDHGSSILRRPWPTGGLLRHGKNNGLWAQIWNFRRHKTREHVEAILYLCISKGHLLVSQMNSLISHVSCLSNVSIAVGNICNQLRYPPVSLPLQKLLATRSGAPEWTVTVCEHCECGSCRLRSAQGEERVAAQICL
jgi:hypothetical protein